MYEKPHLYLIRSPSCRAPLTFKEPQQPNRAGKLFAGEGNYPLLLIPILFFYFILILTLYP